MAKRYYTCTVMSSDLNTLVENHHAGKIHVAASRACRKFVRNNKGKIINKINLIVENRGTTPIDEETNTPVSGQEQAPSTNGFYGGDENK